MGSLMQLCLKRVDTFKVQEAVLKRLLESLKVPDDVGSINPSLIKVCWRLLPVSNPAVVAKIQRPPWLGQQRIKARWQIVVRLY